MKKILIIVLISFSGLTCYKAKPIKTLPEIDQVKWRTLFIGLDGVDYELMKELKDEGYFTSFNQPVPLVSTFPSATTIGFQGIFRPLGVKKFLGYETRFYSYKKNKIIGGTLGDVYHYEPDYKHYFDRFRHSVQSKAIMYVFPSMASKQDLVRTKKVVRESPKNIIMTYLGGTDGSAHILGRKRTKRTLISMDKILKRIQTRHLEEKGRPIRIILFSDHGFQYTNIKSVSTVNLKKRFKAKGFNIKTRLDSDRDIVFVKYGLLSAGVVFAYKKHREEMANIITTLKGVDLVFWHLDSDKKIYIKNSKGEFAYFEYRGKRIYRYVTVTGDPLRYGVRLGKHGLKVNQWIPDETWKTITYNLFYPDAGFRLYDSFFDLITNKATIMFSLHPNYQFGSLAARIGTWTRIKQHGTHGGLFRQTTWAFSMTNMDSNPHPPKFFRYDEFFKYYLPKISRSYRRHLKKQARLNEAQHRHDVVVDLHALTLEQQLLALEQVVFDL